MNAIAALLIRKLGVRALSRISNGIQWTNLLAAVAQAIEALPPNTYLLILQTVIGVLLPSLNGMGHRLVFGKDQVEAVPAGPATVSKFPAVLIGLALLGSVEARAANVDLFAGATSFEGASGEETLLGVGLDFPLGGDWIGSARALRQDLDGGYETAIALSGEYHVGGGERLSSYATVGTGLAFVDLDESLSATVSGKHHKTVDIAAEFPDESFLFLTGGIGFDVKASEVLGLRLEAIYTLPVQTDSPGGVGGTFGVSLKF